MFSQRRRDFFIAASIFVVLTPVLWLLGNKSRNEGRRSSCQSQLKQIALCFKQYTADYDEKFPLARVNAKATTQPPYAVPFGWADAIQPYLKNTEIYQCPNEATPGSKDPTSRQFSDYFYNQALPGNCYWTNGSSKISADCPISLGRMYSGISEAALTFISQTVMLGDSTSGTARNTANGEAIHPFDLPQKRDTCSKGAAQFGTSGAATRHLGGMNFAFADGHVKWLQSLPSGVVPSVKSCASGNVDSNHFAFAAN